MHVQEVETARRLKVNCVMLAWEDKEYGLLKWKQQAQFGKHTDVAFDNPDWMVLVAAFGWHGHHVTRSRDFVGALEHAATEPGPSLLVVAVDYRENMLLNLRLGGLTRPSLATI